MTRQTRTIWTAAMVATLVDQYPHKLTSDIAKQLGVGLVYVYAKANRLGLRKTEAWMSTETSGRIVKGGNMQKGTQFKPGQVPWNAGLKGWSAPGAERNQFKKGNRSGTALTKWQPVGSYRVVRERPGQQHVEKKISDETGPTCLRWRPVARLVWEAAHGPIPPGMLVVFKRGMQTTDPALITIDKLDCITRSENVMRNHPRTRDPELGRLYQLKGAITRQVNLINKKHNQQQRHDHTTHHPSAPISA